MVVRDMVKEGMVFPDFLAHGGSHVLELRALRAGHQDEVMPAGVHVREVEDIGARLGARGAAAGLAFGLSAPACGQEGGGA